ncbi:MAG TPA: Dabb family protein [Roseiflexaceae bacterium]|nr:Dabb family protein [Roseiflexaceae bacterium]
MLKHIVMFKKKPDTDEATVAEIMRRLEALKGQIPGLRELRCFRGLPSDRPVVYTFLLDSTLEHADQLPGYLSHPAHVAVNEWMSPFLESRAVVDYEL